MNHVVVEWTVQLKIVIGLVEWPAGLWDEQYYMGLVAFRYSGQTVGRCPAAAFFKNFCLKF